MVMKYPPGSPCDRSPLRLDLGAGLDVRPDGFVSVDLEPPADVVMNLANGEPWDFFDDSVDELYSSHMIEHIPAEYVPVWSRSGIESHTLDPYACVRAGVVWRQTMSRKDALYHFFDEAFRVVKNGAPFNLRCPWWKSESAVGDPTHRRLITPQLINYLSKTGRQSANVREKVDCNWIGRVSHIEREPPGFFDELLFELHAEK